MVQKTNFSGRSKHIKVKTAKGRRLSSTRWLQRQLNDPYVQEAKRMGYRSRAAFKLTELDDRFKLFKKGQVVVDLGCAPGGWTQIVVDRIQPLKFDGYAVGIDLQEMEDLAGATLITSDFTSDDGLRLLSEAINGREVDVVISDMAPKNSGHPPTDHLRIMGLAEMAYYFAKDVLKPGGHFLAKVLQGGTESDLLTELKTNFTVVKHAKPEASRKDSKEMYVLAMNFKGKEREK